MKIYYQHTSTMTVDSKDAALEAIYAEVCGAGFRAQMDGDGRIDDLVVIDTPDGDFVYLSQADADADETGASAFARIDSSQDGCRAAW